MRKYFMMGFLALFLSACGVINPGERGVFVQFGEVDAKCYPEGLQWYNPILWDLIEIDVKPQAQSIQKMSAATFDIQEVFVDVVANFIIDPVNCHKLVKEVGTDFAARLMIPAIIEEVKAASAKFTLEKIIQARPNLKKEIEDRLTERLDKYYIKLLDINLVNLSPSSEFMKSVERKQIVLQEVQTAENERLKAVKNAERLVAEAKGQAEYNKLLQESLKQSPEVIKFKELDVLKEKWDGRFPQFVGSGGIPLFNFSTSR